MRKIFYVILLCSVIFAQAVPIPQIDFSPKKYICYRSYENINVDGLLNESSWEKAEWTDYFVDIEGSIKPKPRFSTRAKMLWDDDYFYIAAELEEPHIWGTLKNRDDIIFYDNDFEVFIDPDGNTHGYVEFEMNALNTIWDLLLIQPYRDINKAALHQFDIKGLKSGVQIFGTLNQLGDIDSCWTVEIAFPWKGFEEVADIPIPPENNDQWRINFSRVQWKTEVHDEKYQKQINPETNKHYSEDNWVWSPQGVVNMHYPEMWGYVQFSTNNVGTEKASFIETDIEKAKWYLRQIYYKQRSYYAENGKFTNNLEDLDIKINSVPGFIIPPVIESTTNMFEANLLSEDGTTKININNHGLVWEINQK